MENADEASYFTEKFVEAALAGCVPIYHANDSVRNTFLVGADWIDPADFSFDPRKTIDAALRADREAIAVRNQRWIESNSHVIASRGEMVMQSLADILRLRISDSLHAR
jgi:hypothetical protein